MERYSYAALYHSGTRGMVKGIRNYQNKDGTWTEIGKARRRATRAVSKAAKKAATVARPYVKSAAIIAGMTLVSRLAVGLAAGAALDSAVAAGTMTEGAARVADILAVAGSSAVMAVPKRIAWDAVLKKEKEKYKSLEHSGRKGMHWGERNYQNPDGTWTELGKARRRKGYGTTGRSGGVDYWRYSDTNDEAMVRRQGALAGKYDEEERRIMATTYSQPPSEDVKRVAAALGLKVKNRQTSMMEDRVAVNPNWTGNNDGYSNNCTGCSLTYILRRKGLDVNAGDIPNGATAEMRGRWIQDYDNVLRKVDLEKEYEDESNHDVVNMGHKRSYTDILEDKIKSEFSGDLNSQHYGILNIFRPRGSGHTMAWEYDPKSKSVIFMESQEAGTNAMLQIERIGTGQTLRQVEFVVDPKINMESFAEFGTDGNGRNNTSFVDKSRTSLKIKNTNYSMSSLSRIARDDSTFRGLESEEYNSILEPMIKRYGSIDAIPDSKKERAKEEAHEKAMEVWEDEYYDDRSEDYISYKDYNKYKQPAIEGLRSELYDKNNGGSRYSEVFSNPRNSLMEIDARSPENLARVKRYYRSVL